MRATAEWTGPFHRQREEHRAGRRVNLAMLPVPKAVLVRSQGGL